MSRSVVRGAAGRLGQLRAGDRLHDPDERERPVLGRVDADGAQLGVRHLPGVTARNEELVDDRSPDGRLAHAAIIRVPTGSSFPAAVSRMIRFSSQRLT